MGFFMKSVIIIVQILFLYTLSLLGNAVVHWLHLPLPGSIIGLIMLLILLHSKIIPPKFIAKGAGFLLSLLTLLFIPATVGAVNYPELLSSFGLILLFITVASTILSLIITGLFAKKMQALERTESKKEDCVIDD